MLKRAGKILADFWSVGRKSPQINPQTRAEHVKSTKTKLRIKPVLRPKPGILEL